MRKAVPGILVTMLACPAVQAARSLNDLTGSWQLFVDDHLVAAKQKVSRRYHAFGKYPANPVLRGDKPWEGDDIYLYGTVLPTEQGPGYRMWYHALPGIKGDDAYRLLYATSQDGIHWEKPELGLVEYKGSKANNIFIRRGARDHILSVLHLPWESDPAHRYLMINFDGEAGGYMAAWSPDGIHWRDAAPKPVFTFGGDVGQVMWDFHNDRLMAYAKVNANVSGMRRRAVAASVAESVTSWGTPQLILAPDSVDDRWAKGVQRTHFYGLSAFAYETMYLGFVWVYRATDDEGYFDGPIFIELVSSRDGIHWRREEGDRPPILELGPDGSWDDGMLFTPQHPLVVDGRIHLYYGGIDAGHAGREPWHGAIGLATLRKDGFVSLDAGAEAGTVTTKPLAGLKGTLRLNYRAAAGGRIRVELLRRDGQPIPGYTFEDCEPLTGDSIDQPVVWHGRRNLPAIQTAMSLRISVQNASIYSFHAGDSVKVTDSEDASKLALLYTFEEGWSDVLRGDGEQRIVRHGDVRTTCDEADAAFGKCAARIGSEFSPRQTLELHGTENLGTAFTLAMTVRSKDHRPARLFSSFEDRAPIRSDELVFDCDPAGQCMNGLRLICKGIPVVSDAVSFADGKYHHVAVTYDRRRVTFYLDGAKVGQGLLPGGEPVRLARNLQVGEDTEHGREEQLRGHVDDVMVLGRALSAQEIQRVARSGAAALSARPRQR